MAGKQRAPIDGRRSDLLDYLERYRASPRRELWRVERWRRRGWRRVQIVDRADRLALDLKAGGIGAGDRVGLYMKDGPTFAAALFGVLEAGATAVPIDVAHAPDLVADIARRVDLAAWVGDSELPRIETECPEFEVGWTTPRSAGDAPPLPPDDPEGIAEIVLTSGTTQLPQSVEIRHENVRAVLDALEAEIARYRLLIRLGPRLRLAVALPMSHLYGQFMGLLLPAVLDADVAVLDTMPTAELAAAIRREKAWALASVPHTLASLLDHLVDEGRRIWGPDEMARRLDIAGSLPWRRRWLLFARLRRRLGPRLVAVVSGGAALAPDVESGLKRLGYLVVQGYGLTEAAPLVTLNHPFHARRGSVGKPLPGVEVRLAADGEILVRGRNVAKPGQHGPQVDAEGWLHTGDIGEQLDDGSIRFLGRSSDRIVTAAGVNVEAAVVVEALRATEQVVDAAALEQPWGEAGTVCAVMAVRPGADAAPAVREANMQLPDAARVRAWFIWPYADLPRTPTGKIRRGEVVEWLRRQAPGGDRGDAMHQTVGAGAVDGVLASIARPGDAQTGGTPAPEARIGDLLSSLDRVELAARLEDLYGVAVGDELFAGDQTIGELAAVLQRRPVSQTRPEDRDERAPHPAAGTAVVTAAPTGRRRTEPDPARWRHGAAVRAARFVLREGLMHPLSRLFLRIEVRRSPAAMELCGPFLLAVNHVSSVDGVVMFAFPPGVRARLAPAARWNYFTEKPRGRSIYSWAVLGLNVFPLVQVGDWRPTLRIAGDLADRGHSIVIYPEGAISRDGELHPFQRGVAVMSRDLHLPIVPCATAGLERFLPPGTRRPRRDGLRRKRVGICVGDPLPAARPGDDLDILAAALKDRVRDLRDEAEAVLVE